MKMDKLGARVLLATFVVKGKISYDLCESIVKKIVDEIGLNLVPGQVTYEYPYKGRGGKGFTFIQPITESFIAWDVWEDMEGGYLIICSCKLFWVASITKILKSAGLKIIKTLSEGLSLDDMEL